MNESTPPNEGDELEQSLLREEQEDLAGVDTSIRQSVEAVEIGREAIVERILPNSSGMTNPAQVVNAGRKQVLQNLRTTAQSLGEQRAQGMLEQLTLLNDDLAGRLGTLASQASRGDATGRRIAETQIQATLATYLVSVGKVLNPLRFETSSAGQQLNERKEKG